MSYTILVIEDNKEMLENIASILELARYNVLTADNGKFGVELAQEHIPDLILCDVMMPELDGYGVLHILGKNAMTAGIPFIFLTAKSDLSDVRTGMSLGADDYITKPFDTSDLLNVIEIRLKKHEIIKTSFSSSIHDIDDFFNKARQLKEFQKLSENRQCRKVKKKDFVYMEGQEPLDLFFIQDGEIKTYKSTQDGKELVTGIHSKGEFIGFVPLLENSLYTESAVALVDSEVYLIPRDDFAALIYSNREIARVFIKLLSNNLYEAEQRLLEMAYQSVRQRVASSLLKIHDHLSVQAGEGLITISRKDISGIVGTATESLNRTLADFKSERLIELTDSGIKLLNRPKLEKLTH
jgi:CRP-like cAMP-binding protein